MKSNWYQDLGSNHNTGVEYEIALLCKLLDNIGKLSQEIKSIVESRDDYKKIKQVFKKSDVSIIFAELKRRQMKLVDCRLETQNDEIGPADIIMLVESGEGLQTIGLSVKYANKCTLNITGKSFLSDKQIEELKSLQAEYSQRFVALMKEQYGDATVWFRKRLPSHITNAFIDLIRDAVINNWHTIADKKALFSKLYQTNSPIEYWVFLFERNMCKLTTTPPVVPDARIYDVKLKKYQTSYIGFYLDERLIGKMQVKFNNGFLEKEKKQTPDMVVDEVKMAYGKPFSSWNFSVVDVE